MNQLAPTSSVELTKKSKKADKTAAKITESMSGKNDKSHAYSFDQNYHSNASNVDNEQSCAIGKSQRISSCDSKQAKLHTQTGGEKRTTSSGNSVGKTDMACMHKKRPRGVSEEVSYRNSENDDIIQQEDDSNSDVSGKEQQWTQDTHRQFVEAIYEIGMTHASPSLIMEQMTLAFQDGSPDSEAPDRSLSSEHLKSHLQKYRKNKQKSKEDFMREYDQWLTKARGIEAVAKTKISPAKVAKMIGYKTLLGGDAAAHLTYSVMMEGSESMVGDQNNGAVEAARTVMNNSLPLAMEYAEYLSGAVIRCPSMTEDERHSPVGVSLSYVIGMFYSLTRSLMAERHQAARIPSNSSDVPNKTLSPPR